MKCLNCQTDIGYERLTKKYCNTRCRMQAHRANQPDSATEPKKTNDQKERLAKARKVIETLQDTGNLPKTPPDPPKRPRREWEDDWEDKTIQA